MKFRGSFYANLKCNLFIYLLLFYNLLKLIKRVISKRDGCVYLKQAPSSDGSLELI
jgi:hypothetical protein